MDRRLPQLEYLLPLKWVEDGSGDELYSRHEQVFPAGIFHCRPKHPECRNGKVDGVLTGVDLAKARQLIIADDDVRYTPQQLEQIGALLEEADVVRPQNYFSSPSPLPWHSRWDTGRILLNRAFGADYPGTLAVRTAVLRQAGGYSGDVLFENLELLRSVRAAGGVEKRADDLFVTRLPSSTAHFFRQRVRQAYDGFAQPLRLAAELSLLPVLCVSARKPVRLAVLAASATAAAEYGRRRDGGRRVWGPASALWAPLWLVERALCVWVAVYWRLRGGIPYSGARLKTAAHSVRRIRGGV